MRMAVPLAFLLLAAPLGAVEAFAPRSFLYVLQDLDPAAAAAERRDLVVTDYSRDGAESGRYTADEVAVMRRGGATKVLAYLSIGEAEDYRYYWQDGWRPGAPAWLGPANPDWRGNYKVRYWDAEWRAVLFGAEGEDGAYLDRILARGFDGVWLDVVDAYEHWGPDGTGENPDAAADMRDLVLDLAAYARARRPGFLVVPQNAAALGARFPEYLAAVDGIGAEDTWYLGNRLQSHWHTETVVPALDLFRDAGKPVLCIDYPTKRRTMEDFAARAAARGYVPTHATRDLERIVAAPDLTEGTASSPPDGSEVPRSAPPTLSLTFPVSEVVFGDATFARVLRLRVRGEPSPWWTPTAAEWRRVLRFADREGLTSLAWWATHRSGSGGTIVSAARTLVLVP